MRGMAFIEYFSFAAAGGAQEIEFVELVQKDKTYDRPIINSGIKNVV